MFSFLCHCKDFYRTWLYILVARGCLIRSKNCLSFASFIGGVCVAHILCVFTFLVPCCAVRCDFHIKAMYGSFLPAVVCMTTRVVLCCLCLFAHSDVHHFLSSYVFMFQVLCCDARNDFRINWMFGSSLPPLVCRRAHALFMLFVYVACPTRIYCMSNMTGAYSSRAPEFTPGPCCSLL
jgi:hypothetical protein